jgi:hypothetical protein
VCTTTYRERISSGRPNRCVVVLEHADKCVHRKLCFVCVSLAVSHGQYTAKRRRGALPNGWVFVIQLVG